MRNHAGPVFLCFPFVFMLAVKPRQVLSSARACMCTGHLLGKVEGITLLCVHTGGSCCAYRGGSVQHYLDLLPVFSLEVNEQKSFPLRLLFHLDQEASWTQDLQ